LRKNEVKYRT